MTDSPIVECLDAAGRGLRATFVWHRDRYAHTIAVVDGQRLVPLLASHEGSDQQDWPPSPPLQQLTMESRGTQRLALLVGMAGTSHWSLSVVGDAAAGTLLFEAACRAKQPPQRLGSSYRTMTAAALAADAGRAVWQVGELSCELFAAAPAEPSPATIQADADEIAIVPSSTALQLPATIRWTYGLRLA